ncbi:hypothetical protein NSP01_24020, partial [Salmonella enterica]|nr:hypothetical protein [Salmonella enterica]
HENRAIWPFGGSTEGVQGCSAGVGAMKEVFKVITFIGVTSVFGILFALLVLGAAAESREWEKFKAEHNCRVTGKMSGDVNVGYGVST